MARTMTPSGTPRPIPILAEALRPPGRGVGETCVVERTDVEEMGRVEACRDEVDMGEVVSMMIKGGMGEEANMVGKIGAAAVEMGVAAVEMGVAAVKMGAGAVDVMRKVWTAPIKGVSFAGRILVTITIAEAKDCNLKGHPTGQ